jgi:hypothetical protein
MTHYAELESRAAEKPSASMRRLMREAKQLRGKIERKKEVSALKILAAALRVANPTSFAAYKLRNIRYALLKARGISANHTYPQFDSAVTDRVDSGKQAMYRGQPVWKPVSFRTFVTQ